MLSHPLRRCGSGGGYLPAKVTAVAFGCALDAADASADAAEVTAVRCALDAAVAWSKTGNVAPMRWSTAFTDALGTYSLSARSGFLAFSQAMFANCSTAAAALRAAAAKAAVLLEPAPVVLGIFGFGTIVAAPRDEACGDCQPLCVGGHGGTYIVSAGGACRAFPPGELIPHGERGVREEPWTLPAMAAAVTAP